MKRILKTVPGGQVEVEKLYDDDGDGLDVIAGLGPGKYHVSQLRLTKVMPCYEVELTDFELLIWRPSAIGWSCVYARPLHRCDLPPQGGEDAAK